MKVQLVLPPASLGLSRSRWMMPLGLLSIATCMRQRLPDVDVGILDGNHLSEESILDSLSADVVGLSIITANCASSQRIARVAADRGALVVAGGALATHYGPNLRRYVGTLSAIVRGDGEGAFCRYLADGHVASSRLYEDLDALPAIDRALLDVERYTSAYQSINPSSQYRRPFTLYTQRGCRHRHTTGGCRFCSILDAGLRSRAPCRIWNEVEFLERTFGADLIWDVSDSIAGDVCWLERFVSCRPSSVATAFCFYIRSGEVTEHVARLLSQVNCTKVFVGVESGNDQFLLAANKGSVTADNIRAAKLLSQHGIGIHLSFILGFPGETAQTVAKTRHHIEQLLPYGVDTLSAHIMTPEPGSQYFAMLSAKANGLQLCPERLRGEWVKRFCGMSLPEMYEASENILASFPGNRERDYEMNGAGGNG